MGTMMEAQVSFRGGVRATLAALLQVPADSVEAAVSTRGPAAQPALVTRSAAGAAALVITDSFDVSALVAPPVRLTAIAWMTALWRVGFRRDFHSRVPSGSLQH